MAGLKAIKTKIRSIEKTQKVTKAMEAVSAAKMRKAQSRAFAGRAYARAAVSILSRVSGSRDLASSLLTEARPVAHALYIVITSDKGLAGALDSAVLRATSADLKAHGLTTANTNIIAVGRKANDFFTTRGFTVLSYHQNTDQIDAALIDRLVASAAEV